MILGAVIDTRTITRKKLEEKVGPGVATLIACLDLTDVHLDEVLPGLHVIHVINYEVVDGSDEEE